MKRALIVAPHFAPINAPDGHRVRLNLPHYAKNGWRVEVLAVRPEHRADWRDDSLLESLPADIPVHRCGAIPLRWSRFAGIGNMGWRALPFLATAGTKLLASGRFDLVAFSTTQFSVLTLGPLWRAFFGIPFVIDLQDPWHNDYYSQPGAPRPPGGWKHRIAHLQSSFLEPLCFRRAAGFSFVSEDYRGLLDSRYPWFAEKQSITLPFAAPIDDFARLSPRKVARSSLVCRCVGALNRAFCTSLNAFFAMASAARQASPQDFPWRFEFIGTSYAGAGRKAECLAKEAAKRHGMEDLTSESTDRVSYGESLRLMCDADLLVSLGSDDARYAPSRLATLCASGRPVVVVATEKGLLMRRAAQIPGVMCVPYEFSSKGQPNLTGQEFAFRPPFMVPNLPGEFRPQSLAERECQLWDKTLEAGKR